MYYFLIICILVTLSPSDLFSHGLGYQVLNKNIVGLEVQYDNGAPLIEQDVIVYRPGNTQEAFLKSKTNEQGQFFFKPDKAGEWIIVFKDQMGHAVRANIKINKDRFVDDQEANHGSYSFSQKLVMIFSVLWGLIGTALFFSKKNKKR